MRNPGYLVKLKDGRIGRTYHSKGLIDGKVPVYLGKDYKTVGNIKIYMNYETKAILCNTINLDTIGFID